MDVAARREILERVEIFSHCKRGDLKTLAKTAQEVRYAPAKCCVGRASGAWRCSSWSRGG